MRNVVIVVLTLIGLSCPNVFAQNWTFNSDDLEYVIDLPTANWRAVSRVDVHKHVEFVNGSDQDNGYLRLSKILLEVDKTAANLFRDDEKWNLQRLPGYVACGSCDGEAFRGRLNGRVFSYEYVSNGRTIAGRVYYLEIDKRTFYALRFTVAPEKLRHALGQMDSIARSFRLRSVTPD